MCHCTGMEIRRQLVKVLSFYKMVSGTMLVSRGLVPSPPGPSHSSLSILSRYRDQATTKANTEECICACSPQGLKSLPWEGGMAAGAQAKSHILSDKHVHREQLKWGEAPHSRSLPP